MALKILKFDAVHPAEYLALKRSAWADADTLSAAEYRRRVFGLRLDNSDSYSHYLSALGWEAEDFPLRDPFYLEKLSRELYGFRDLPRLMKLRYRAWLRYFSHPVHLYEDYVRRFKPDVIFVKEPSAIPSSLWQKFRKETLLVSRLAWLLPGHWLPQDWDLLYTLTPEYQSFFELHGTPTVLFPSGFDPRLLTEVAVTTKTRDVTFVGQLGGEGHSKRTDEFAAIAARLPFQWWGRRGEGCLRYPQLSEYWQGLTGGLDMYRIYAESRIAINSYADIAGDHAVNQRLFEVVGMGTFLLTRESPSLTKTFPEGLLCTYRNESDLADKARYFLKNESEREELAKRAQEHVLRHYSYPHLMKALSGQLIEALDRKRGATSTPSARRRA